MGSKSKIKNSAGRAGKFVYEQFRQKSLKMMKMLIMARAPFTVSQLKTARFDIMKTMKTNGFESHYVKRMKTINKKIESVTSRDLLNDDYWADEFKVPFWVDESPELYKKYLSNLEKISTRETGIASLTNLILNDKFVKTMFNQDWMNEQFKILMKSLLSSYYLTQPGTVDRLWPVHLNIDLSYRTSSKSANTPNESIKQLIQACFAGSGPFVLKILQQINIMAGTEVNFEFGDGKSTSLEELASEIFKNVPPLTEKERKLIYETFREDSGIEGKIGKLLGSASIAEAHLYTTPGSPEPDRVMKFIKPIYAYYFLCETDFLLNVTWKQIRKWANGNENHIRQTRQTLMYFVKEFSAEFDYRAEYEFTQMGKMVYEIPDKITSVKIYQAEYDPFPVFIMNKLEGVSVDDLIRELEISKKKQVMGYETEIQRIYKLCFELYKKWIENALFGTGFFHADMHPGNLFIERSTYGNNKIHILDYGSSGKLTKTQQCKLLNVMIIPQRLKEIEIYPNTDSKKLSYVLTANIERHRHNVKIVEKFIRAVNELCEITYMEPQQVKTMAPYLLDYKKDAYGLANSFNHLFTRYMEYATNLGSCANNSLILFGRGMTYLDNLMYRMAIICENKTICPEFPVGNAITPLIVKNLGRSMKCAGGINLIKAATNSG